MGCHNKNFKTTESELLKIAHFVCKYSPGNILLIGGGNVLQETAGYRRMRNLSDDLDFIINDEGFSSVNEHLNLRRHYKNGSLADGDVAYVNDILIGLFYKNIKGYEIPVSVFESPRINYTSAGVIYSIPEELNVALKIRRGSSRKMDPKIYGKDSLDFASIHAGMDLVGNKFNVKDLVNNMTKGVCQSCCLSSKLECFRQIKQSSKQLRGELKTNYLNTIDRCADRAYEHCTRKIPTITKFKK
ncbi:hypothetical protein COU54_02925 [Candidatus Pacearchaeota archaeon CG10_big_fil_rev_8_21_14_0_10_31_24]|nr:MAG: hypothetical protein COU54_02925 [Candidatus Pacearchaeota archaeon CG10_big_fil_rev_8_21_14_0_10_31_24]